MSAFSFHNNMMFIRSQWRFLLFGLLLAFFSSPGQTFFISLFSAEIRSELNLSHGDFGIIYAGWHINQRGYHYLSGPARRCDQVAEYHPVGHYGASLCNQFFFSGFIRRHAWLWHLLPAVNRSGYDDPSLRHRYEPPICGRTWPRRGYCHPGSSFIRSIDASLCPIAIDGDGLAPDLASDHSLTAYHHDTATFLLFLVANRGKMVPALTVSPLAVMDITGRPDR